jgi:hypothetical protein
VGNFVPLVIDEWEGGHPWWEEAYIPEFLATLLSWLALGAVCVFRYLRRGALPHEGTATRHKAVPQHSNDLRKPTMWPEAVGFVRAMNRRLRGVHRSWRQRRPATAPDPLRTSDAIFSVARHSTEISFHWSSDLMEGACTEALAAAIARTIAGRHDFSRNCHQMLPRVLVCCQMSASHRCPLNVPRKIIGRENIDQLQFHIAIARS